MPSAAMFRLAAGRFDELAEECRSLEGHVVSTDAPAGLAGRSRVHDRVTNALETATETADGLVDVCTQLAQISRERADACDAYEAALRTYHAQHHAWSARHVEWRMSKLDLDRPPSAWPGDEPVPPDPPEFYSAPRQPAGPR